MNLQKVHIDCSARSLSQDNERKQHRCERYSKSDQDERPNGILATWLPNKVGGTPIHQQLPQPLFYN
jgi:hypothetical protein